MQQQEQPPPSQQQPAPDAAFLAAERAAAEALQRRSVAEAKGFWQGVATAQRAPLCEHGEAAELKRVGKSGANHGRYFYVCGRPAGLPPEGQCSFFKWVSAPGGGAAAGECWRVDGWVGGRQGEWPLACPLDRCVPHAPAPPPHIHTHRLPAVRVQVQKRQGDHPLTSMGEERPPGLTRKRRGGR